ncbi:MAG: major capsid protein, partial [Desulfobulbaceae bacterium]|nr:major capsid protein [Desulfobulbaceae bacterium]
RVLDVVFKRKKRQLSSVFSWDVKTGTNQLMDAIAVSAEATVRGGIGRANITCNAPRYSEKELITAADIADMRKFGSATEAELIKERVGDEQADMKANVDLTREFQAVKALEGKVVDKNGKTIVDFNFPAEHKPVLTGTALWTDADSDPIKNLRAWKKMITRSCGGLVTGWHAFCGSDAMDALMSNANALEKLKFMAGQQIAEEGRIARLAKVEIEEYDGAYTDSSGTVHDMIPANVFALVGLVPDGAAELFAPVIDLKAPGGVGKGKKADIFFSKMWESEDPSGKWIKIESRPLPALMRLVVVWAEVTA